METSNPLWCMKIAEESYDEVRAGLQNGVYAVAAVKEELEIQISASYLTKSFSIFGSYLRYANTVSTMLVDNRCSHMKSQTAASASRLHRLTYLYNFLFSFLLFSRIRRVKTRDNLMRRLILYLYI